MSDLEIRPRGEDGTGKGFRFLSRTKDAVRKIDIRAVRDRAVGFVKKLDLSSAKDKLTGAVKKVDIGKLRNAVPRIDGARIRAIANSTRTKQMMAAVLLVAVVVAGSVYYYNYKNTGYAVKYNGKFLGYVRDKNVAFEAFESAKGQIQSKDSSINITNSLEFEELFVKSDRLTSGGEIAGGISSALEDEYTSFALVVNGSEMAVVDTEDEGNQVIEGVRKYFAEQEEKNNVKVLEVKIKDDIQLTAKVVDTSKVVDVKTAITALTGSKGVTKKYTVKSGDSIWRIARNNDMKMSEILAVNPGLDIEKLKIGQEINLSVSEPNLNVETTIQASSEEKIKYGTRYVSDSTMYKGQTKVVEKGQYGINEVVRRIVKLNGKQIANTIISAAIAKNPVVQVVAKGTKSLIGTGKFLWPVKGVITSGFGSRWGGQHKGLDIGAPRGTSIYAADSGTVIQAGWYYGYGKCVIIDHGNGYQTLYGHCSSISVSAGQTVKRGQYIAAVGATGNATGNHLHFEVRVNGVAQSPLRYLR